MIYEPNPEVTMLSIDKIGIPNFDRYSPRKENFAGKPDSTLPLVPHIEQLANAKEMTLKKIKFAVPFKNL